MTHPSPHAARHAATLTALLIGAKLGAPGKLDAAQDASAGAQVEAARGERAEARRQLRRSRRCIVFQCLDPVRACSASEECGAWLECIEGCGDDRMLCPTVCGAFYQAPQINAFTGCALEHGCIELDFSELPPCAVPEGPLAPVGDIDGFWWVSAIHGHDYVLYDDCQRFVLEERSPGRIEVENSTSVTYEGETRMVRNPGHYSRATDGVLELSYDNWVGYLERYHPVYSSASAMVMHVCSQDTTEAVHDYGALVLTRVPLATLPEVERAGLEEAVARLYGLPLEEFRPIGTEGCPNGP